MKKTALKLTALVFCFLMLFGCSQTDNNKQETRVGSVVISSAAANSSVKKEELSMTFAKLPSPPKCKKIKDQETIHKILEYIENYKKVSIDNQKEKGWQILITATQPEGTIKQYSVIGDKLKIDNECYKVSEDFISNLEGFYEQIDVPEEKY